PAAPACRGNPAQAPGAGPAGPWAGLCPRACRRAQRPAGSGGRPSPGTGRSWPDEPPAAGPAAPPPGAPAAVHRPPAERARLGPAVRALGAPGPVVPAWMLGPWTPAWMLGPWTPAWMLGP